MKKEKYCDLHTHTTVSDGVLTPEELVLKAIENNITVLAFTDHNRIVPLEEFLRLQKKYKGTITLIRGTEATACQIVGDKTVVGHYVVLFPEPACADQLNELILKRNAMNSRRPKIEEWLKKLDELGVGIGTYEDFQKLFPGRDYFGKLQIGEAMVKMGHVKTCSQAINEYIGECGERKAYVQDPNRTNFCTLEELVKAVKECRGIIISCHLEYYRLENEEEELIFVGDFAELTRGIGGIETEYRIWPEEVREKVRKLAKKFGLFPSAASDYHGGLDTDGLDNKFPISISTNMLRIWAEYYYGDCADEKFQEMIRDYEAAP